MNLQFSIHSLAELYLSPATARAAAASRIVKSVARVKGGESESDAKKRADCKIMRRLLSARARSRKPEKRNARALRRGIRKKRKKRARTPSERRRKIKRRKRRKEPREIVTRRVKKGEVYSLGFFAVPAFFVILTLFIGIFIKYIYIYML